ncbi:MULTISPECIES: iron-containing alcohol dehydrogenase [unclassified Pseudomonas]|uniref:iron-containing alcohol dehydrogenase n=1 Tax=unclassified Pseudomonas TaxID=196821 RepID=UPI00244685FC|nr:MULTISPECIES: iron-containing alcohol dehydrogenase [unclassified Pseudomonas]MDG9925568.1 iron-containing alcohol dehydrogenase [Pseudomonas sp. GD04045]MDH0035816.1 iron-containing alcohol dehydrogenase [Pseudomonas sp. GD04019]
MSKTANWNYPTSVRFGAGRIQELPELCKSIGMLRPLLVTDRGLGNAPITLAALDSLKAAGLGAALFSDLKPNPVESNLAAGLAAYHAGKHDGVVAFGGGSGLDMGKLIAFMSGQARPVWDFEDIGDWWTRADPRGIAPVIAVPTTAGTGSEVGRAGILTDERSHTKRIIFHPLMMPKIVISDPALSVGMPAFITAGTGMDAFSHCLEAYCAPGFHPLADGIAVEGMRLVKGALVRAVKQPDDLDARADMLAAAAMGATAFQKGLGGMHALAHPIGALYDTHHGMTNATLMPYVLKFNRSTIEERITRLAAYLQLANPGFDSFLELVLQLRTNTGVPHSLAELGVDDGKTALIAQMAVVDPSAGGNPLPLTEENVARLFTDAVHGRL